MFSGNAISDAFIKVRPDTRGFKTEAAFGIKSALSGIGAGRTAAAVGLGAIGGTATIVAAALGASALEAGRLEQALNVLQATAELTDDQMEQAAARARELGADLELPGVSATDAANALLELSKAGLSFEDAMAGTKGVLTLASAANLSFAQSAEFVGNALNAFQLPGEQAIHVVDLLANASKLAQGDIADFGLGMQQSAAVANLAGVSVDELTGLLTLLAKAGISGSDAGTSIRTTLLRLIPTGKEAADVVKALGISVADQEGNIRPLANIFEQYRQALSQLDPVTRQAALSTIFGTDAIRAASIFARAGAQGIEEMTSAVGEQGTAAEIAAAKNQGMLGAFRNLGSQGQTLAATLGGLITPAITDVANAAAGAVGDINDMVVALKNLDLDIPGGDKAGAVFGAFKTAVRDAIPGGAQVAQLKKAFDIVHDALVDEPEAMTVTFGLDRLTDGLKPAKKILKSNTQELARLARLESEKVGAQIAIGTSQGIIRNAQQQVTAAKQALADTIRAGNEAVQAAAVQAKQSLIGIGQDLSSRAAELIDAGPLGRKIRELQDQLTGRRDEGQQRKLGTDLQEAQNELERAKRQALTAGTPTSAQQRGIDAFLQPFEDRVADAQSALEDFSTEGVIKKLQDQQEAMKKAVTQGIADTVAAFNTGRIDADTANRRIADALGKAVPNYKTAGAKLGLAFNVGFTETLKGISTQISEIISGPQTTKTGFEPSIVSPGEVAARAAGANAAAAASVAQAQQNLVDTTREQLVEQKAQTTLLEKIAKQRAQRKPLPPPKTKPFNFVEASRDVIEGPRGSRDRSVITVRGGG